MFKTLTNMMFYLMLTLGTLVSISSNSWLSVWMGLEINLLSFIPIMNKNKNNNNKGAPESTLNYFLVQAFASTIFLFLIILFMLTMNSSFYLEMHPNLIMMMINMTLMMKLGAAPFHFWFPNVSEKLNWLNNFILMTWQKIAPMMIMSYTMQLKTFLLFFIITSTIIGAVGGFNQTSLRKLMAFSSINHLGWMISAMMFNETLWLTYFYIYSFLNMSVIFMFNIYEMFYLNQLYLNFMKSNTIKFCLMISFLSLGGLPPFLGFLPKWLIIQSLLITKMNLIALIMIMMSLVTLFYYLKICLSSFLMNNMTMNFKTKEYTKSNSFMIMFLLNFTSLSGLMITINLLFMTL